jgi:hypothetical protein
VKRGASARIPVCFVNQSDEYIQTLKLKTSATNLDFLIFKKLPAIEETVEPFVC